jgi:predicted transcriptional regulator
LPKAWQSQTFFVGCERAIALAKISIRFVLILVTNMPITISLSPDIEARLHARAEQQGQDVNTLAAELLTQLIEWEQQDTEEAIAGIQRGLDDFVTGQARTFQDFATEQRQKYDLPTES